MHDPAIIQTELHDTVREGLLLQFDVLNAVCEK